MSRVIIPTSEVTVKQVIVIPARALYSHFGKQMATTDNDSDTTNDDSEDLFVVSAGFVRNHVASWNNSGTENPVALR